MTSTLIRARYGPVPASPDRTSGRERLVWIDAAKGIAIVLVVLFHSAKILEDAGVIGQSWLEVNRIFTMFRMPLFFAASGLFAASAVRRPWAELWSSRLVLLLWPFVTWTLLRFAYYSVWPMESRPEELDPSRLLMALWAPPTGLWFLYALAAFTLLARFTWRISPPVQLGVAAAVSAAVLGPVALPFETWDRMAAYYVFFLAPLHLRGHVLEAVERWGRSESWALLVIFAAGAFAVLHGHGWLELPLGLVAVLAGFAAARRLIAGRASAVLRWLGRRTLPIYVAHVLFVSAVTTLLVDAGVQVAGERHEVWLPVAVSAVALAASLLLWSLARRTPLRLLYAPR